MINCNILSFFHRGHQSKISLTSSADVLIGYSKYIIVNILILPTYVCYAIIDPFIVINKQVQQVHNSTINSYTTALILQ